MVKSFNQKKTPKKKPKKRREIKKFISLGRLPNKRKSFISKSETSSSSHEKPIDLKSILSSKNSETDNCLNVSVVNWAYLFLEKFPLQKGNNFDSEFINYLKILKFDENKFIEWILYIEYYINRTINITNKNDLESFFYLGLLLNESYGIKSKENNKFIKNKEKMDKLRLIFEEKQKQKNLIEFFEKFNYFSKYSQQKKTYYYDLISIIDYICDSNSRNKNKEKNKETNNDNKENEIKNIENIEKDNQNIQANLNITNNPTNLGNQDNQNNKDILENVNMQDNNDIPNEIEPNHTILNADRKFEPSMNYENNAENGDSEAFNCMLDVSDLKKYDDANLPNDDIISMKLDDSYQNMIYFKKIYLKYYQY